MSAQTSMLHVRVDDALRAQAAEALAQTGLTTSAEAHDLWFHAKVLQALESLDTATTTPQADVMAQARAVIAQKRRA